MLDLLFWWLPLFGAGDPGPVTAPVIIVLSDVVDVSPTCELADLSPTVDVRSLSPAPEVVTL